MFTKINFLVRLKCIKFIGDAVGGSQSSQTPATR